QLTPRLTGKVPERGFSESALSVTGTCPVQPMVSPLTLQRQLFAHDASYCLRCQRLLRASNLSLERFVDEGLIAATGLLGYHAKVLKHVVIKIQRDAGF